MVDDTFGQPSVIGKMDLRQDRQDAASASGLRLLDALDMSEATADYRIMIAGNGTLALNALSFVVMGYTCAVCKSEGVWSSGIVQRVAPHLVIVDDAIAQIRNNARAIKSMKQSGAGMTPPTILLAADAPVGELKMMTLTSGADGVLSYSDGADAAADAIRRVLDAFQQADASLP